MTITKFGMVSPKLYNFSLQQTVDTNFRAAKSKYDTLMGVSGGLSQYGRNAPPGEMGRVTMSFVLKAYDRADMTAKRDAVEAMRWWGEQLLWYRPTNYPTEVMRFCRATVKDVVVSEKPAKHTDLHQPVTVIWDVGDPRWLSWPGDIWYWDDGTLWDAEDWVEARYSSTTVNASSTISLTNNGNAPTPLVIRVTATANVSNFELLLLDDTGAVINGFRYENTLESSTNDVLTINSENLSILHDKTTSTGIQSGYPYFARIGGNGWLVLPSGTHTLEVNGTFTSNVTVEIEYYDAWSN